MVVTPNDNAGLSKRFATWMSQCDTCPECCTNLEPPRHVEPTRDGYEAYYRCTDCRHTWTTAWRDE